MTLNTIQLGELMLRRGGSVDPSKHKSEEFDLYSIPAFDKGASELVMGCDIGSSKQQLEQNDVLLSKIVPHIRRAWVVGKSRGRRQIGSGEWIVFRSKDINPKYLSHVLVGDPFHAAFMQTVSGVGGSLLRARPAQVAEISIPLPPLAEQKRIARILDAADALRAKRREALAQLDALLQSTFLTLFGDPVAQPQKLPVEPLESLLARPLQNGVYYPKETYVKVGGVEMVHMSDAFYEIVPRGMLKRVTCPEADIEKYALTMNDVLIARRSLTLEGAAKPCLIPKSDEPLIFESSFIRVTPRPDKITALYLYHYLGNDRVKQQSVRPYVTQSTISGINQSNLEKVPVIVPPLPLQQKFARIVESVERQKTAQRAHLADLDALFAALQHRAFRGEL